LHKLLAHPLARDIDIDDPRAVERRRRIIREKQFLSRIYREWYLQIAEGLPPGSGPILELGSGPGFLREYVPDVMTSDVFHHTGIDVVLDGAAIPLADETLHAIVMLDVLHHIAQPRQFFSEASRVVQSGGGIVMIEPWVTRWSTFVYSRLHHEPFRPDAREWEFPSTGPLSGANGALPWILFERDRNRFETEFPEWTIARIEPLMPFRYLLSGGSSMRSLMPNWSFELWRAFERALHPWVRGTAMFARIVLMKV
jgi:SAM-dependent methyltransferase